MKRNNKEIRNFINKNRKREKYLEQRVGLVDFSYRWHSYALNKNWHLRGVSEVPLLGFENHLST